MKKEVLVELVENGLTYNQIATKLNIANSTVSYWLKKYQLKTKNEKYNKKSKNGLRKCAICNEYKNTDDFYKRAGKRNEEITSYCKKCNTHYHTQRMRDTKIKMINYKGGSCKKCNLSLNDSNYYVFDFHHLNPFDKDPNFSKIKFRSWKFIISELDKCILVCANCHRTIHYENKIVL